MSEEKKVNEETQEKHEIEKFIEEIRNGEGPVSREEFIKFIEYMMGDMSGLVQMALQNNHNIQQLDGGMRQIISMIRSNQPNPPQNRTKGGLILP